MKSWITWTSKRRWGDRLASRAPSPRDLNNTYPPFIDDETTRMKTSREDARRRTRVANCLPKFDDRDDR